MKRILIYISLFSVAAGAFGQTAAEKERADAVDPGKVWSMEECMAYAADHSYAVEQARWDLATASTNRDEALAEFFPSVSAQVGGQFNWGRNIDPETNTYNNVTTFNNGYGIYASVMLFDGGQTYNRYRQARVDRARSVNSVQMQRDDRAITTMMAYVDAVYYRGAVKIAADRLEQSRSVLTLTKLQEELGIKGYPDVAQAEATVAGDEYNLVQQRNLHNQAMLKLRSTMNYPADADLQLDTTTSDHGYTPPGTDDVGEIYSIALTTNPTAIDADMNVKSQQLRYRTAKGAMFPTLSFNAGISTSYFKTLTGGYAGPGFGEQFRNNRGEYISATLSIPLFSNLNRISGVKRARHALEKARSQRDETLRRLHDDIALAIADRDGYAMEIISLRTKTEADRQADELNHRKYEEGLMSLTDRQLSANAYFASKLELLRKEMMYILKNKLVDYYKGNQSWMSR